MREIFVSIRGKDGSEVGKRFTVEDTTEIQVGVVIGKVVRYLQENM